MAEHLRIRCVVKTDRTGAHERIHAMGGAKSDGSHWKLTQDNAINLHFLMLHRTADFGEGWWLGRV